jgi:hypothetical protein
VQNSLVWGQTLPVGLVPALPLIFLLCLKHSRLFLSAAAQIVQNSLVWGQLQWLGFPKAPSKTVPNNGYQGIERIEVKALWALVAIECALLVFFLALSIALMWVPYMSACKQHRVSAGSRWQ